MNNAAQAWQPDDREERAWRPATGDSITGIIIAIEMRDASWQGKTSKVPVLILDTDDDEYISTVWAFHTVLLSELKKLKPRTGERISIRRLNDHAEGRQKYKRYRLNMPDRTTPSVFSWDSVPSNAGDIAPEHLRRVTERVFQREPGDDDDDPMAGEVQEQDRDLPF